MKRTPFKNLILIATLTTFACGTANESDDTIPSDDMKTDENSGDTCVEVADRFVVGYAEVDITPPEGTILGGYGVPAMNRVTTGTHDPLLAQAAFFANNAGQALLIISADLAGYMWDFGDWGPGIKVLRESIVDALSGHISILPEQIIISSSHSHGATDLMGFSQDIGMGPDKDLLATTISQMTAVAVEAAGKASPATVYFATGELTGWSARDKDCSPVIDNSVNIIQARDESDNIVFTIANYAKHPTTAPESNRLATADFIWGFREEMKKQTAAPAIYLQGFEAAVHGRYSFYDEDDFWDKVYETGAALADAVSQQAESMIAADSFEILHRETTYSCVGRESFMVDAYTYMDMPKRYMDLNEDGSLVVAELPMSWHLLGPAELVVFPGEASPEYSIMSKDRMVSRFKFTIGLGNDATGYIVEPQSLENDTTGQLEGYELKMGLGPEAGPSAWAALESLGWFDGAWNLD